MPISNNLFFSIGAKFELPRGSRSSTVSSIDSSYLQMNPSHQSNHPGYMQMTPNGFDTPTTTNGHTMTRSTGNLIASRPMSPITSPTPGHVTMPRERHTKYNKHTSFDSSSGHMTSPRDRHTPYDKLDITRQTSFDSSASMDGIHPLVGGADMPDGSSSPLSGTLTRKEVKQLKKFNKEPLVNISPTVHSRRKAEYIDIDLPDTASEGSGEGGFTLYDVPTSKQSLYDVPPVSRPLLPIPDDNTYDIPSQLTYDIPTSSRSTLPQIETPPTLSTLPRPSSASPTSRALPHLPTDYENVKIPPQKHANGGYVNIGFHSPKPNLETGLYMEVPLNNRPPMTSQSMNNIYSDIPEKLESQLSLRRVESDQQCTLLDSGIKLAKALEEDGYEFINPAMSPALKSPPVITDTVPEEDENDLYIEVNRSSQRQRSVKNDSLDKEKRENVDFFQVQSRSKRLSDGYEEITDVVRELRERELTPPNGKPDKPTPDPKEEGSRDSATPPLEEHENKDSRSSSSPRPPLSRNQSNESDRSASDCPFDDVRDNKVTEQSTEQDSAPIVGVATASSTPEPTKLIFNGEVEEIADESEDEDDEDFEQVSIAQISTYHHIKGRSSSECLSSSPGRSRAVTIAARESKFIPTALGSPVSDHVMVMRKRSSTLGDIIDGKEPKKHTYVNVPDTPLGISPKSIVTEIPKKKPPMPLPRPSFSTKSISTMPRETSMSIIDPSVNDNHCNNKVRSLVRQFSDF